MIFHITFWDFYYSFTFLIILVFSLSFTIFEISSFHFENLHSMIACFYLIKVKERSHFPFCIYFLYQGSYNFYFEMDLTFSVRKNFCNLIMNIDLCKLDSLLNKKSNCFRFIPMSNAQNYWMILYGKVPFSQNWIISDSRHKAFLIEYLLTFIFL